LHDQEHENYKGQILTKSKAPSAKSTGPYPD
jgi:hypothetical protein